MRKLAVLLLLLAGAGTLTYVLLFSPERRACSHLIEMCDRNEADREKAMEQCHEFFTALGKAAPDASSRVATCINESASCAAGMVCQAQGLPYIGAGIVNDWIQEGAKALDGK